MNNLLLLMFSSVLLSCSMDPAINKEVQNPLIGTERASPSASNHILVSFRVDIPAQQAKTAINKLGGKVIRVIARQGVYQVELPTAASKAEALVQYKKINGVIHVEVNAIRNSR